MSEDYKIRIINEVIQRLWDQDLEAAVTLKRYMNETDYIKDLMLAVVKGIGYAMNELELRDEKAAAFNRCKFDLARAVDEHNSLTRDGYEQTFRSHLNCIVQDLKLVDEDGKAKKDDEAIMEVTLRFPAREYSDNPHSLTPGKGNVCLMMKEL